MPVSPEAFNAQFRVFQERCLRRSGVPFTSFHESLALEWEGYKLPLRGHALGLLNAASWRPDQVGKGQILEHVIAAIEITKTGSIETNNMVAWQNRYGHASRSHRALLDARDDAGAIDKIEDLLFSFYQDRLAPDLAFNQICAFTGARYDLLAYLLFLKDETRFMPILVSTFDAAFSALEMDLVTRGHCSWENFYRYNASLQDIRTALQDALPDQVIRLVDAHSFCWLLVRKELDQVESLRQAEAKKKVEGRVFTAVERAIWELANMTESTVRQSGQQANVIKKVKELWMGRSELETHIRLLLDRQERRCALTGIPLEFKGQHTNKHFLVSLDRIDSSKHYSEDNLQVVCRFVNGWKSDMPNDEFVNLLAAVRGEELQ